MIIPTGKVKKMAITNNLTTPDINSLCRFHMTRRSRFGLTHRGMEYQVAPRSSLVVECSQNHLSSQPLLDSPWPEATYNPNHHRKHTMTGTFLEPRKALKFNSDQKANSF